MSQSESLVLDLVVLLNRGAIFVQYGNRGKKPKNKSANLLREEICKLVQTKCEDTLSCLEVLKNWVR